MRNWFRRPEVAPEREAPAERAAEYDVPVVQAVRASRLFDAEWYLRTYPDVAATGTDPAVHFVTQGAAEGRNPGPEFETAYYLNENVDVAAAKVNPLFHYIESGEREGRQRVPRDPVEGFEAALRARKAGATGVYRFSDLRTVHIPVKPATGDTSPSAGLPLPPLDLAKRIGSETLDQFDQSGADMKRTVMRCLPRAFSFASARCLDFGCGVGRMIRHFAPEAEESEFWGCDTDGAAIRWCTENLSPPFRFFQLSESASLPFESSSFDVVFAIGVFSQVYADWQHWAMEFRRILKTGGVLVLSYAGQTPFEEMMALPYGEAERDFGMFVANPFASWNRGGPNTFLSPAWIKTFWGVLFDIDVIAPDAMMDYHSLAVMRKPTPGPARPQDPPVLELGTRQRFNPDATGKIAARYDRDRPLGDSYGIEAHGQAVVEGWIVFRDDAPEHASVRVDGQTTPVAVAFAPHLPYRDWNARVHAFHAELGLAGIPAGRHTLTLDVRSRAGKTHSLSIPLAVLSAAR